MIQLQLASANTSSPTLSPIPRIFRSTVKINLLRDAASRQATPNRQFILPPCQSPRRNQLHIRDVQPFLIRCDLQLARSAVGHYLPACIFCWVKAKSNRNRFWLLSGTKQKKAPRWHNYQIQIRRSWSIDYSNCIIILHRSKSTRAFATHVRVWLLQGILRVRFPRKESRMHGVLNVVYL